MRYEDALRPAAPVQALLQGGARPALVHHVPSPPAPQADEPRAAPQDPVDPVGCDADAAPALVMAAVICGPESGGSAVELLVRPCRYERVLRHGFTLKPDCIGTCVGAVPSAVAPESGT